jgi:hypothetical protein
VAAKEEAAEGGGSRSGGGSRGSNVDHVLLNVCLNNCLRAAQHVGGEGEREGGGGVTLLGGEMREEDKRESREREIDAYVEEAVFIGRISDEEGVPIYRDHVSVVAMLRLLELRLSLSAVEPLDAQRAHDTLAHAHELARIHSTTTTSSTTPPAAAGGSVSSKCLVASRYLDLSATAMLRVFSAPPPQSVTKGPSLPRTAAAPHSSSATSASAASSPAWNTRQTGLGGGVSRQMLRLACDILELTRNVTFAGV